jgi:hypothetical protein
VPFSSAFGFQVHAPTGCGARNSKRCLTPITQAAISRQLAHSTSWQGSCSSPSMRQEGVALLRSANLTRAARSKIFRVRMLKYFSSWLLWAHYRQPACLIYMYIVA